MLEVCPTRAAGSRSVSLFIFCPDRGYFWGWFRLWVRGVCPRMAEVPGDGEHRGKLQKPVFSTHVELAHRRRKINRLKFPSSRFYFGGRHDVPLFLAGFCLVHY